MGFLARKAADSGVGIVDILCLCGGLLVVVVSTVRERMGCGGCERDSV